MSPPERLPLDLLETFVLIADLDGDAAAAGDRLGISQPTISKRLAALRRATTEPDGQPWLLLKGRRWQVTPEGQRVRSVVTDLVHRYRQMERFVAGGSHGTPVVSIACGQQAASGFVKTAIEQFLKEHSGCRVRLSTPRGKTRIEGVAGGQFDLAVVTDSPATIRQTARVDLFLETLFEDRFVLAANPPSKSAWSKPWLALPTDRPVTAQDLLGLPFLLPEPDSSRRRQFEEWIYSATGQTIDVVLETGGWQNLLEFAASGLGVAAVTHSALHAFQSRHPTRLTARQLDADQFPADAVRLIARKVHGKEEADLTEMAGGLLGILRQSARELVAIE